MHSLDELKLKVYSLEFSFIALLQNGDYEEARMIEEVLGKYYKLIQNEEIKTINARRKTKIKLFQV